jgi:hypothetical protein
MPSPQTSETGVITPVHAPHVPVDEHVRLPGLHAPVALPMQAWDASGAHSRAVNVQGALLAKVDVPAWSTAVIDQERDPANRGAVGV